MISVVILRMVLRSISLMFTARCQGSLTSLPVMFNLVYTSLPIIVFGLCEQSMEAKVTTTMATQRGYSMYYTYRN